MPDIANWLSQIPAISANPAAIQRLALQQLDETAQGSVDIVDANSPFVFLMEASAVNAAGGMIEARSLTRKQYPSMALTDEELYLHMSDVDYLDRFAIPSRATYYLLLGKDELYARAVATGVGDIRKITIPRNSQFTINEINFTMQYPIDVRIMGHGGLQIVYNTDLLSPLESLSTNIVDWSIVNIFGQEFVRLEIPVSQFTITSHTGKLNLTTGFSKIYAFDNQFYYARAYYFDTSGKWVEIRTTHTDQVFDPTIPTIVLQVLEGQLRVSVPQVYLTTGLLDSEIRIDIYTTRGPLNLVMADYDINNFNARWIDLQGSQDSLFYAPLTAFSQIALYSDQDVVGGRNALTFDQLRQRVILNILGSVNTPITNVQLTSALQDLGYSPVSDVDNITNRVFLATRALPVPLDTSTVSGAACTIQTLQASMDELTTYRTVQDNGERITILPSTLFSVTNGILTVVADATVDSLMASTMDARARLVNQSNYLYTPFHYVLDESSNVFDLRAYYLDAPNVESKVFVAENDTAGIEIGTGSFSIVRTPTGYLLTLVSQSSEVWKGLTDSQVNCQLAFVPAGEKDRAYLNGTLIGTQDGERVYTFALDTNYDLDGDDNIVLTSFQMYADPPREHSSALLQSFDVFYTANGIHPNGLQSSQIDLDMGNVLLPVDSIGITHEQLNLQLGATLDGLWRRSRSVASSEDYQRYTADVPATYTSTVYQRDPVTGQVIITLDGNGDVTYAVLHAKDDPVLDEQGQPTFAHRAGDAMLDPDGKPIVISSRHLLRQVDLCLIDGVYWFATELMASKYKQSIPKTIVDWVSNDIGRISKRLLEQTKLYFYPKSTIGNVKAIIREGKEVTLLAKQTFSVVYYLTAAAFRNAELRPPLTQAAIQVLNTAVSHGTVAISDVIDTLRAVVGNDVIALDIQGLGGSQNLSVVTMVDDSTRLSIGKLAIAEADGTLGVADAVSVTFLQHTN